MRWKPDKLEPPPNDKKRIWSAITYGAIEIMIMVALGWLAFKYLNN
jgi:hypothetical protein